MLICMDDGSISNINIQIQMVRALPIIDILFAFSCHISMTIYSSLICFSLYHACYAMPTKQVPCTTEESTIYFTSTIPKELFGVTLCGGTQYQRISSIGKNFNLHYTHPNPSTNTVVGPGRPRSSQVKDLSSSTLESLTSEAMRSNALLYPRMHQMRYSQNGLSPTD